jgi:hypothetical protein
MLKQLSQLLVLTLASMLVMIFHEFPKAYVYNKMQRQNGSQNKNNIYSLQQYIDPIGLIFCVTNLAGFSKPYMYRINDKKINKILGITGMISLIITFLISISIINMTHITLEMDLIEELSYIDMLIQSFLLYVATVSIGMLVVNLFPIATFDMGLLIASKSSTKFFSFIRKDYIIKMILIIAILFGIISNFATLITSFFLFV